MDETPHQIHAHTDVTLAVLQLDFTFAAIKGAAALQKHAPLVQPSQLLHLGIKPVLVSSHAEIDAAV